MKVEAKLFAIIETLKVTNVRIAKLLGTLLSFVSSKFAIFVWEIMRDKNAITFSSALIAEI